MSELPGPSLDVAACVERVRHGDEDAARALFRHLYPLVARLVRSHLPRRTSQDDLVQTVFMKVFANLDRFSGAVPLEHWVSRIAINTCLNQLAAEKARPGAALGGPERGTDGSVGEGDVRARRTGAGGEPGGTRDRREATRRSLPPPERLLLTLLHLEGRSIAEVQQITGWNVPVIKVRAFRARRKLRKAYESLMSEKNL